jgi:hypothetical protein
MKLEQIVCVNCGKKLRGPYDITDDDQEVLACDICGKPVCGDCAVHLSMWVNEGGVRKLHSMRLCPNCAPKRRKLYKAV